MNKRSKPPLPRRASVASHLWIGLCFLVVGGAAFGLRRRLPLPPLADLDLLDAAGTICWAAVLTVCLGLLLRRTPLWSPWTWILAILLSMAVESFQSTPYPARIQAAFPPAHLLLGSTFSWMDMALYPVGVALAWSLLRAFGRSTFSH
ncbi:DUF2809 domain-containing protein [Curtobacterium sp. S6]|uniref:DUF2809 domain-containing protein n=1 Tax=Curtobacterium sp. S6 TaxID=1479623 RepID=UPI0009E83CF8